MGSRYLVMVLLVLLLLFAEYEMAVTLAAEQSINFQKGKYQCIQTFIQNTAKKENSLNQTRIYVPFKNERRLRLSWNYKRWNNSHSITTHAHISLHWQIYFSSHSTRQTLLILARFCVDWNFVHIPPIQAA